MDTAYPPPSIFYHDQSTFPLPCSLCRRAKRACKWAAPMRCDRCTRLNFVCPGPTIPPIFARKSPEEEALQSLNMGPSSPAQALGCTAMASALVYDLVTSYKNHLKRVRYTDPDLSRFRLEALSCSGQMRRTADLMEIKFLIYLIGGAKLSRHSSVIGEETENTELGSFADFSQKTSRGSLAVRRRVGYLRQSILQDLSDRLVRRLDSLLPTLNPATARESFTLAWIGLRELGAAGVDSADVRGFVLRLYPLFSAILAKHADYAYYRSVMDIVDRLIARDPSVTFHVFLSKYARPNPGADWIHVLPPSELEPFDEAISFLPPLPLRVLSSDELSRLMDPVLGADEIERYTMDVRTAFSARQRTMVQLLVYVSPLRLPTRISVIWAEFDRCQDFFAQQTSMLWDHWSTAARSDDNGRELPRGLYHFIAHLLQHQSTLVLFAWAAIRETRLSGDMSQVYDQKFDDSISNWVDNIVLLMQRATEPGSYEFGISITQSLKFIKGPELARWSLKYPRQAFKLLTVLDFVSVALPNGGKLRGAIMNPLVENLELQQTTSAEDVEKEMIAKEMVREALESMTI